MGAQWILIGAIAAGVLVLLGAAIVATRRQRHAGFRKLALQLGLVYAPSSMALMRKHRYLDRIRQSLDGPIRDIVSGVYRSYPVHAFHYTFAKSAAGVGKGNRHESCFLLEQDRRLPDLRVYPLHLAARSQLAPGLPVMQGGGGAFSQQFTVYGKDREFARTILHNGMVKFLLQHPDMALILEDSALIITNNGPLRAEVVQHYLDLLVHIRQLMPEHLYEA